MKKAEYTAALLLEKVPGTETFEGRNALLACLPATLVDGLSRQQGSRRGDLVNVFSQLSKLESLADGTRPIVVVLEGARDHVAGTSLGDEIGNAIVQVKAAYERGEDEEYEPPGGGGNQKIVISVVAGLIVVASVALIAYAEGWIGAQKHGRSSCNAPGEPQFRKPAMLDSWCEGVGRGDAVKCTQSLPGGGQVVGVCSEGHVDGVWQWLDRDGKEAWRAEFKDFNTAGRWLIPSDEGPAEVLAGPDQRKYRETTHPAPGVTRIIQDETETLTCGTSTLVSRSVPLGDAFELTNGSVTYSGTFGERSSPVGVWTYSKNGFSPVRFTRDAMSSDDWGAVVGSMGGVYGRSRTVIGGCKELELPPPQCSEQSSWVDDRGCVPKSCTANATRCTNGNVESCKAGAWILKEKCGDAGCADGVCKWMKRSCKYDATAGAKPRVFSGTSCGDCVDVTGTNRAKQRASMNTKCTGLMCCCDTETVKCER